MNLGSIKDKTERHKKQAVKKIISCVAVGCVAIVAVGMAVKLTSPKESNTALVLSATPTPKQTESTNYAVVTSAPETETEVATEASVSKMLLPLSKCNVLKGYASDMLLYSGTLKHWCTHCGLDLAADEGAEVMCALDGTVTKVEEDALMGKCVTVEHENGYETYYASLDSVNENIAEGTAVLKGQSLGTVGTSAASESDDGAHLHFEVFANGQSVDPQDYLSDLTK